MATKICIIGVGGRMGKNIATAVYNNDEAEVTGAVDRKDSPVLNQPVYEVAGCGKGGALISSDILESAKDADVIIDFTGAEPTYNNLEMYEKAGKALVIGSTGFSEEQKKSIEKLSEKIPVVLAPNMSLGVNVALSLIEEAARLLKGYDIELVETHHNMKKDAPSGTAMAMAEAAASGAGINLSENAVYARHGIIGERKKNEIGIQTLRGGDVAGDHTVFFFGQGERIEITHRAHSRQTFAQGALKAALWLAGKEKGLYNMKNVLGLA